MSARYMQSKIARKFKKYSSIVHHDFNIEALESPSPVVMVCNLTPDQDPDYFAEIYSNVEKIVELVPVPDKSYCFIVFEDEVAAQKLVQEVGPSLFIKTKKRIYFIYCNQAPNLSAEGGVVPSGLSFIKDFISQEEEAKLLKLFSFSDEPTDEETKLRCRRVKHFGFRFNYENNGVTKDRTVPYIPDELTYIIEWLRENEFEMIDQVTVSCYDPGEGIAPHIDTHAVFDNGIAILSLGSSLVMTFARKNSPDEYKLDLLRGSMLVLRDAARYEWTHGISRRKSDIVKIGNQYVNRPRGRRISITFRTIRRERCKCMFPHACDDNKEPASQIKETNKLESKPAVIEAQYVKQVYDKIASNFNDTRRSPWPNIKKFVLSFDPGAFLLDIGCGNARYFAHEYPYVQVGMDQAVAFTEICESRGLAGVVGHCLNLPFASELFDGAISIAVYHHLATAERRLAAIQELVRVLKKGGKALVYVWARDQNVGGRPSHYASKVSDGSTHEQPEMRIVDGLHVQSGRKTPFAHNDLLVPWITSGGQSQEEHLRFYHLFEKNELDDLFKSQDVNIIQSYYDSGNWCVEIQKNDLITEM